MDQRQFFLRDILTVLFKHKALLILLPVVVLAVVILLSFIWPPTYQSVGKVQLMRGREVTQSGPMSGATSAGNVMSMVQLGVENINSEMELMRSQDVLRQVVTGDLKLANNPHFPYGDDIRHTPYRFVKSVFNNAMYVLQLKDRPEPVDEAVQELDDRLLTEAVRDSYVINVALRMGDAEMAQSVLTELLKVYQTEHIKVFSNPASAPFFREQRDRIERELRTAQNEMQEFLKDYNISLIDTEKELLLEQYTDYQNLLSDLEETAAAINVDDLDASIIQSLSSQTESTVVREMQLRLLELLGELDRVSHSLGKAHPTVQNLKGQVLNAQTTLVEAIATTRESTQKRIAQIEDRLQSLNETKAQSDKLQQQVDILSTNFETYSQQLEESFIADELANQQISNVRIISSPSLPDNPIRPNKLMNLLIGLIGGIVAALALAFFLDYLDHGLKTPEDLEYYTKLAPLASFFNGHNQALDPRQAERLAVLLDTTTPEAPSRILQVTSSVSGEGSNQVASALATAYGNDPNSRTLLVDLSGDVTRAKNARYGLTDVLLDQAEFEDVFDRNDSVTIVGRGSHSDYPVYLWNSDRMRTLVTDLRGRYKHIILHVGPVLQSQDALTLARHADQILLVVKADSTRREVVNRALDSLKDSRAKVVGAVLTERTQNIPQSVYRRI